jgi:BlaI family transcriptional regulator, penicillinase repressor
MTRLSPLELRVMESLWRIGPASIRELQQTFAAKSRPAYSTVQTIVYRLEAKKAVRRAKKISNAHIFEAVVARSAVHRRLIDDFLALFDGRTQPLMAGLIENGRLTFDDIEDAERMLQQRSKERTTP